MIDKERQRKIDCEIINELNGVRVELERAFIVNRRRRSNDDDYKSFASPRALLLEALRHSRNFHSRHK